MARSTVYDVAIALCIFLIVAIVMSSTFMRPLRERYTAPPTARETQKRTVPAPALPARLWSSGRPRH